MPSREVSSLRSSGQLLSFRLCFRVQHKDTVYIHSYVIIKLFNAEHKHQSLILSINFTINSNFDMAMAQSQLRYQSIFFFHRTFFIICTTIILQKTPNHQKTTLAGFLQAGSHLIMDLMIAWN